MGVGNVVWFLMSKTLKFVMSKMHQVHHTASKNDGDCPYSDSNRIVDTVMAMGGNFMSPHSEAQ